MRLDLSQFTPVLVRLRAQHKGFRDALLGQQFVRQTQAYMTRQMDKAVKDVGSSLKEGMTRIVRGQVWRGWAIRTVTKYGQTTTEGTRWYMRKQRRGLDAKRSNRIKELVRGGATAGHAELDKLRRRDRIAKSTFAGTIGGKALDTKSVRHAYQSIAVRDRPWEKVWRLRASGQRYSESSNMMRDTGALSQSWVMMRTAVSIGSRTTIEFRPGTGVNYLDRQNTMRRFWVWELPKDEAAIAGYAQTALNRLARETFH